MIASVINVKIIWDMFMYINVLVGGPIPEDKTERSNIFRIDLRNMGTETKYVSESNSEAKFVKMKISKCSW